MKSMLFPVVHTASKFIYELRLAKNVWSLWDASWAMWLHRRGQFLKSWNLDCISHIYIYILDIYIYIHVWLVSVGLSFLALMHVCTSKEHHIACSLMGSIVLETLQLLRHHPTGGLLHVPPLIVKFLRTPNPLRQSQWDSKWFPNPANSRTYPNYCYFGWKFANSPRNCKWGECSPWEIR